MVRLNRHKLPEKLLADLFSQLNNTIGKLSSAQANKFLYALLGTEEREMIAKRLAIIVMLLEGYSMYRISQTLKVSPTTVEKIKTGMSLGAYKELIPLIQKNSVDYKSLVSIIDSILTVGGIMPRYGQARLPKQTS